MFEEERKKHSELSTATSSLKCKEMLENNFQLLWDRKLTEAGRDIAPPLESHLQQPLQNLPKNMLWRKTALALQRNFKAGRLSPMPLTDCPQTHTTEDQLEKQRGPIEIQWESHVCTSEFSSRHMKDIKRNG